MTFCWTKKSAKVDRFPASGTAAAVTFVSKPIIFNFSTFSIVFACSGLPLIEMNRCLLRRARNRVVRRTYRDCYAFCMCFLAQHSNRPIPGTSMQRKVQLFASGNSDAPKTVVSCFYETG
jgi:hypothetical protein